MYNRVMGEYAQHLIYIGPMALAVALVVPQSRYWLAVAVRRAVYENFVVRLLRNKFLQIVLPAVTGSYFLVLDIWGDKWPIVTEYQDEHALAFSVAVASSLLVLTIRGAADFFEESNKNKYADFLERFSTLTSRIVQAKLRRFKEKAERLNDGVDIFKTITQPKDQINLILGEILNFISYNFGLKEDDICITIMHQDPASQKWYFRYETNKSLNHTKPERLLAQKSAAKKCLDVGEPIFLPDKQRASKRGEYFLSERDRRKPRGSAFCYPAVTNHKTHNDTYVISLITYGKCLCSEMDSEQADAIKEILSNMCKRIDLELTLDSIRSWKFGD